MIWISVIRDYKLFFIKTHICVEMHISRRNSTKSILHLSIYCLKMMLNYTKKCMQIVLYDKWMQGYMHSWSNPEMYLHYLKIKKMYTITLYCNSCFHTYNEYSNKKIFSRLKCSKKIINTNVEWCTTNEKY